MIISASLFINKTNPLLQLRKERQKEKEETWQKTQKELFKQFIRFF